MTARAHVEFDPLSFGIRIAIQADEHLALTWPQQPTITRLTENDSAPDDVWLRIPEMEFARALYEALAEHFGHSGHDTRALRSDYNAERARVDRLIEHVTKGPRS